MKFKSIIAVIISAALIFSFASIPVSAEVLLGDADGNGVINVADILTVKNAVMSGDYTEELIQRADMDQNGILNVADMLTIKSIIMGSSGENPDPDPDPDPDPQPPVKPENPVEGWNDYNGNRFYYSDGEFYTGHHNIGSFKYYFNEDGVLKSYAGVDVSMWQGDIDWDKVKAAGAQFAIVRVGGRFYGSGGLYFDDYFESNAKGAYEAGLDVGAYFYSQAITVEEAVEEADYVLSKIKGHTMTYPIIFDCEKATSDNSGRADKISKELRTQIAIAFCERIEDAGYYAMIYANPDWSENGLYMDRIADYDFWLAHYTNSTNFRYPYNMWQYSESGKVNGISGNVDMNISYVDYATVIRNAGLNHLS